MTRKGRTLKEIRDSQERKPKLIFQLYANSNLQKELNIDIFLLMKSLHLWYTHTHKWITWLFFFFFFQSRRVVLGIVPRPADTDPEWNHQEWHSAGVKIKVRPQNFERTLQILRTCVALKWSPGFLYLWEGLLIDVPQNPDSDLFLQKGPIVLLHSSKGLSLCPPSIPGPHYFKWAWNCCKWTMAANFFTVLSKGAYTGVIKV